MVFGELMLTVVGLGLARGRLFDFGQALARK
jgi:hypothetical protein